MLPDVLMAGVIGRRLDEVAELPFACERRIEKVEQIDRNGETWTRFGLSEKSYLIDRKTGMLRE